MPGKHKTRNAKHVSVAPPPQMYGGPARLISLNATTSEPDQWLEMVPAGTFTGRDGRGPFLNRDPHAVIAATQKLNMEVGIPVDYDHATDYAAPDGRPAPAAGWIKQLRVQHGAIWGNVEWTTNGAVHVKNKDWRYISPVFEYVERNGKLEITCLLRAALTNNPNLELQAIAAARQGSGSNVATNRKRKERSLADLAKAVGRAFPEFSVDQAIQLIEFATELAEHPEDPEGVEQGKFDDIVSLVEGDSDMDTHSNEDDYDDEAMAAEAASMLSENAASANKKSDAEMAKEILKKSKERRMAKQAKKDEESAQAAQAAKDEEARNAMLSNDDESANATECPAETHATLKRLFPHLSDDKIATLAKHTKPQGDTNVTTNQNASASDRAVMALSTELRDLKAERAAEKATLAVDGAISAFKLTPAQREWGIDYATRDLKGFNTFVSKQAAVITDPAVRTDGTPAAGASTGAATAAQRAICANLGIKPEDYGTYQKNNKTNRASMAFDPKAV